jgi:hypothetical protein
MCNYQCSTGKCKISPKKDLCHIHNKKNKEVSIACQIITLSKKNEILSEIIKKQNEQIKGNQVNYDKLYNQHIKNVDDHNKLLSMTANFAKYHDQDKIEIKNLNKTIEKKVALTKELKKANQDIINKNENELQDYKAKMKLANDKIKLMQIDYDKYQIIKKFELKKAQLLKKNIDIYNLNDQNFHNERYLRNQIAHPQIEVL